jgi:hypothetical protein
MDTPNQAKNSGHTEDEQNGSPTGTQSSNNFTTEELQEIYIQKKKYLRNNLRIR